MRSSMVSRTIAAALSVLVLVSCYVSLPQAYSQDSTECWTFVETNQQLCGPFLDYWRAHGGLSRFGFPISKQADTQPGSVRQIQYFERGGFETPLSSLAPTPVELLPLGSDRLRRMYGKMASNNSLPVVPYTDMSGDKIDFLQPSYPLSGAFLHYWQGHGGEDEFGLPVSPLLREESELDGNERIVQYFETAVFEYHPEYSFPFDVLLSQVGTIEYRTLFHEPEDILHGLWCGPGLRINENTLGFGGGASGSFDAPIVLVFGYFSAPGLHDEPFGQYGRDYPGREQNVYYNGKVAGNTITLTIVYWQSGRREGPYMAQRGPCS